MNKNSSVDAQYKHHAIDDWLWAKLTAEKKGNGMLEFLRCRLGYFGLKNRQFLRFGPSGQSHPSWQFGSNPSIVDEPMEMRITRQSCQLKKAIDKARSFVSSYMAELSPPPPPPDLASMATDDIGTRIATFTREEQRNRIINQLKNEVSSLVHSLCLEQLRMLEEDGTDLVGVCSAINADKVRRQAEAVSTALDDKAVEGVDDKKAYPSLSKYGIPPFRGRVSNPAGGAFEAFCRTWVCRSLMFS